MATSLDVDSFTPYSNALQSAALETTRLAAVSLPTDLPFHRSIDPALAHDIDTFSGRVLSLASELIHLVGANTSRLREEEDVVDEFVRNIVDPMEGMLESTDGALDVFLGRRKDPVIHIPPPTANPPQKGPKKQPFRGRLDPALTHASHIPKPQLSWKYTPSNTDESPYIPATLLPHKWCARVPLGYVFHDDRQNPDIEETSEYDHEGERKKRTRHPYYYELTHPSYPDHVFNPPSEPSVPPQLEPSSSKTTDPLSLTLISTSMGLLSMANTIASASELAVDLEHHSYRSCRGFLALMQISTRQRDFIVDLLVPEVREGLRQAKDKSDEESEGARIANEAGQIIARVFADPLVIKVFHGAESDIVWLQQDFNIFVVGLFDTFHASKLLEFPKLSLAYLLEIYCDFMPDKRYQLADWRIRPLPDELLSYARSDTHFLLYIYDMLRLSLNERSSTVPTISDEEQGLKDAKQMHDDRNHGLIYDVLTRSSHTALRLYETEVYDEEWGTGSSGWDTLARKWNKLGFVGSPSAKRETGDQGSQAAVYRAVHRWREEKAREEDESTRYVLPTHYLFLLAERTPTTIPDLFSLFGGPGGVNGTVPPVPKRRIGELMEVIKDALGATKPRSAVEEPKEVIGQVASLAINESEPMHSSSTAIPTSESRLWSIVPSSNSIATFSISRSSLFGVGIWGRASEDGPSVVGGREIYSSTRDISLGDALSKTPSASLFSTTKSTPIHEQISNGSTRRFQDIMEKIHRTLVISPATSTSALDTSHPDVPQNDTVIPEVSDPTFPGPEGQIEIPFVPAYKRQILSNPQNQLKDDTIIVVGRASSRQRKRKREKAGVIASASQSNHTTRLDSGETIACAEDHNLGMQQFDYSRVPNLLDNESKHEDPPALHDEGERRRKKQRQRHGKGSGLFEYGDFRPPPRDQREVRSGNKTHTFR